jgi:hypothetical protein
MSKKTYVKQWSHNKPEEQFNVDVKKGGEPFNKIKPERVSYVVEQVAYWRKFNALHNWFVNECGDGEDRCQEIYIGDRLPELLETLLKVKEVYENSPKKKVQVESGWSNGEKSFVEVEVPEDTDTLDELFPTSSGFFFGGTEYDEYYIEQVNETIELIEGLLKEDENGDYYYQASW